MAVAKTKASMINLFKHTNKRLVLLCILVSTYSALLVYSAAYSAGAGMSGALTHIIASFGGLLIAVLLSQIDYENLCAAWPIWAAISLLLVILTFTPLGLNAVGTDDTAWLDLGIGSFSLTFQPSELMKITFIITFATHLSRVQDHIREFKTVALLGLHAAIPILLVFAQGDDGTALVFIMIFLGMLFVSGINSLYYILGLAGISTAVPILWNFMSDDKKARLLCIIPGYIDEYVGSVGWQQYESLKAIGSGQLTGVGYLEGGKGFWFARNNDLIFTVAAEEFGFLGALLLLVLIALMLCEMLRCARQAQDRLGTYICVGMLSLIGAQSIINLGMNLRLLPVIGITLPFFSAGGSSVATLYLGIGLVLSVSFSQQTRRRQGRLHGT
ncbi:MAG: rod shape-determining protein RodA [Ruminococcaceae bacterium]|nr:rod shape-determining protein RodA [Oscillospiraceae bacterium]